MKIKEGFVLKKVAGETVVLPSHATANMDMMISLNGTAAFLWEKLTVETDEAELVKALLAEYEVDEATAEKSVSNFINKLKEHDFLA